VDVRVRGSSGVLGHLVPGDLVAVIDLSGAKATRRLFHLSPEQVRAPFGVEVMQVSPATLPLDFERSGSRSVPVVPEVEGKPADGYVIDRIATNPATVTVVGPESAVARIKLAVTEPVSVAGARGPVKETVAIGLQATDVRLDSPRNCVVTVTVVPAPVERSLASVPVRLRNTPARLKAGVVPAVVTLVARGPREVIGALLPDSITAFVELAGLRPGQYNLQVHVDPVQNLEILRIDPAVVRVTLR
jgi:YbbR domain-containing protein